MKPHSVVVIGGGIQGASTAYWLAERGCQNVQLLEANAPASAASGKGGGFMARSWGSGPTTKLHQVSFDLFEELASKLNVQSYRKLPVLSVTPAGKYKTGLEQARKQYSYVPSWLDGKSIGRVSSLGDGSDTAQVTPKEFVQKMLQAHPDTITLVSGTCVGLNTTESASCKKVTGVQYTVKKDDDTTKRHVLPADAVVIAAGPWSCQAEDWFEKMGVSLKLPMEGVKSTSIVWEPPPRDAITDATALFCGEDDRFGTHLEVYPRPDNSIYICGIGGSDYISTQQLKQGAFLEDCPANQQRVEAAKSSFRDLSSAHVTAELQAAQACMRPCPPDALPYMGAIEGCENAFINAGHNCWGIAWSTGCGKAVADLVLDGKTKLFDLRPFDPKRFTPKVSKRGRKKQGVDVGEQW